MILDVELRFSKKFLFILKRNLCLDISADCFQFKLTDIFAAIGFYLAIPVYFDDKFAMNFFYLLHLIKLFVKFIYLSTVLFTSLNKFCIVDIIILTIVLLD